MIVKERVKILLADDDLIDRELFREAIDATGINYILSEAGTGQEVLDHLKECSNKFPDFIFLDLNMPIMDGRETFAILKSSEKYKSIPVFILSTSSSLHDVNSSYRAGANLFLVKPDEFNDLIDMVKNILKLFQRSIAIPEIY